MWIVAISDTHNRHEDLELPVGDVLVHAGDFATSGSVKECRNFLEWLSAQKYDKILLLAGNHDNALLDGDVKVPSSVNFLWNESIKIDGNLFYGSSFLRGRDWPKIPSKVDVLVTHVPPKGILDVRDKTPAGLIDLRDQVLKVKPKIHIFGHVHRGHGRKEEGGVRFYNVSTKNVGGRPLHKPVLIRL
jgi:Icc-related predicted phosphoesterase